MAAQCAKQVAAHDSFVLSTLIHHGSGHQWGSRVPDLCEKLGIPHSTVENVNDDDVVTLLQEVRPDIIFSVNNWDVIRANVMQIPRDGIINFHNGPLPDYRGVNAPSWAIINQEKRYGVAWHVVVEKIDAGDIVAAETFELSPSETAISLTLRCMKLGVEMFAPLLDRYASGKLNPMPQQGEGRYYAARELPPGEGYLDFKLGFGQLSALVRGLTFRPFDNPLTYPKFLAGPATVLISELAFCGPRESADSWTCGEIRKIDGQGIVVCAGDALVQLCGLMDEDLKPASAPEIASRCGLTVGSVLSSYHAYSSSARTSHRVSR